MMPIGCLQLFTVQTSLTENSKLGGKRRKKNLLVKSKMKISSNLVAFSKNTNFQKRGFALCPKEKMKVICTSIPLHVQIKLETK